MSSKCDFFRQFFRALDEQGIDYIVLRKHEFIPDRLTFNDDLDLLVRPKDDRRLRDLMRRIGLKHRPDPKEENTYLYGTRPHEHFLSKKKDVNIDVVFQLMYRSRNKGEWIPAHREIQDSMWKNRIKDPDYFGKWRPSPQDEFLDILAHCIFNKKSIKESHQERLYILSKQVDMPQVSRLLKHLFFKFSPVLIQCVQKRQLDDIYEKYIMFKEY